MIRLHHSMQSTLAILLLSLSFSYCLLIDEYAKGTLSCTITLEPEDSIQAAIDVAGEEDTICLAEGLWSENLRIAKPVQIQGRGSESSHIRGKQLDQPVIWIHDSQDGSPSPVVQFSEVSIGGALGECIGNIAEVCAHGLMVEDAGQLVLNAVEIAENSVHGLRLMHSAQAQLKDVVLDGNKQMGVFVTDDAQLTLANTIIQHSGYEGVLHTGRSPLKLVSSSIIDNNAHGIALMGIATILIEDSIIARNQFSGLLSMRHNHITLVDSQVIANNGVGIQTFAGTELIADNTIVSDNGEHGMALTDFKAQLLQTTILRNTFSGLDLLSTGQVDSNDAIVAENGGVGLRVEGEVSLTFKHALFENNSQSGIFLAGNAQLTLSESKLTGNGLGLIMQGQSQSILRDVQMSHNIGDGVALLEESHGQFERAIISENGGIGVVLNHLAQGSLESTTIEANQGHGISLQGSARTELRDSSVLGNAANGIRLNEAVQAEIETSTISNNEDSGILLDITASLTLNRSTISNNGGFGISLLIWDCDPTAPDIAPDSVFGRVAGGSNIIADLDDPQSNAAGALCLSPALNFLLTEEGGAVAIDHFLIANLNRPSAMWAMDLDYALFTSFADLSIDQAGNMLITGSFMGIHDFDSGPEEVYVQSTGWPSSGSPDVFLAKYSPDRQLLWAKAIGGEGDEIGLGIAIDDKSNVLVIGKFSDSTAIAGTSFVSSRDEGVFLAKFDPDGQPLWAIDLGVASETGNYVVDTNISVDGNGDIWAAFGSKNYLAKFDANGNLLWTSTVGGSGSITMVRVVTDSLGNGIIAGVAKGVVDIDPGVDAHLVIASEAAEAFVAKYDLDGRLLWAVGLGEFQGRRLGLAIDLQDKIVVSGAFAPSADVASANAPLPQLVMKFDSDGHRSWVATAAGKGEATVFDVSTDAGSNVIVALTVTGSVNFTPTQDEAAFVVGSEKGTMYLAAYDSEGRLIWLLPATGTGWALASDLAVDPEGFLVILGFCVGQVDLDPGLVSVPIQCTRFGNLFVAKFRVPT